VNWIDLVLILVVALSVLSGFSTGFARAGIGFIAAVLGIFIGFWCYGIVGGELLDYVSSKTMANLIGFFVVYFAVVILGAIVGRILGKLFKWVGLSWFDRLLGGAFGVVRGFIVAATIATVLLAFAPTPPPPSVLDSRTLPYVMSVANILAAMTPHELKDKFRDTRDKVRDSWAKNKSRKPGEPRRE